LLKAVRTGAPAYHEVFGRPFWGDLQAHPDIAADFDALMGPAGHGIPDPEVLVTGGWESVRKVVDVGGGTGTMLAQILRARPEIRATLVDLPDTVARSGETFRSAGVSDRVTTMEQSFFDPLPPGADLYLLKNVLGDWPDREAAAILTRCAEAARPAGRIIVQGGVSPWRRSLPGVTDDGAGGGTRPKPGGVPGIGSNRRPASRGGRAAAVGPLCGGVPPDELIRWL
jgi:2,7-dihydroxy-5-methyl-1-naphthoate 7-O-methyltransferase